MKIIVVGGGPSGMMAAIFAKKKYKDSDVSIIDSNRKLGRKLSITGKGRCNITNNRDISEFFDYIPRNNTFLYSSLYSFTNIDTINFFKENNLDIKVERGERVFPSSDSSYDVVDVFEKKLLDLNINLVLKTKVLDIKVYENKVDYLITDRGKVKADHFIFAPGGASYAGTGSDGSMHRLIVKTGHSIKELKPSLVPLVSDDDFIKDLQGLSLKNISFTLKKDKKVLYSDIGEMLFTHFGLSGPLVLSSSSYFEEGNHTGIIDLKPGMDREILDKRLIRDFRENSNKEFKNSLGKLLPSKLIPVIVRLSGIEEDTKCHSITREERNSLLEILKNFEINITSTKSLNEGIITRGGVNVDEIDPSTMKSKLIRNLSFAGEVIDVDALTGGYNLQIAYSTGYIAGSEL